MAGCCCGNSGCCSSGSGKKKLVIDFLYLDLSICGRCQGTESSLDQALSEVKGVLQAAGYEVELHKVNINSRELARQYEFLSSPTIRVNGKDIALDVRESLCEDCGDLCGDNVDCRVWSFEGQEYTEPPKAMIIGAILTEVYGGGIQAKAEKTAYEIPENLERFFSGKDKK